MVELARKGFGASFDLSSLSQSELLQLVAGETLSFNTPYSSRLSIYLSNSGIQRVLNSSSLKDFLQNAEEDNFIVEIKPAN